MIFVEGDTDKLLFDALVRYYRQQYGAGIASCEVRNLHGVSRYMSKVSGKLRNQIIPAAEKKIALSAEGDAHADRHGGNQCLDFSEGGADD